MAAHVKAAQAAAIEMALLGWAPYVPHANLGHAYGQIDESDANDINDTFLRQCAAIRLLPGWGQSVGSRRELELAKAEGLIVFRSLAEVRAWRQR